MTYVLSSLCRALSFIRVFLEEVMTGEEDLVKCAKKAYENSLKQYHGWMVQGIFSVSPFFASLCGCGLHFTELRGTRFFIYKHNEGGIFA